MAICKSIPALDTFTNTSEVTANAELKASLFYDNFSDMLSEFENSIVFDKSQDIDTTLLLENTSNLNVYVKNVIADIVAVDLFNVGSVSPVLNTSFALTYPNINARLEIAPYITPAETQLLITQNLLVPALFNSYLVQSDPTILNLLEIYFASDSVTENSAGSFCSIVSSVYALYDPLMDIMSDISSFSDTLQDKLSSISEISVSAVLATIKDKLVGIIDTMVAQVMERIKKYTTQFIETYASNVQPIYNRIDRLKNDIQSTLSDNNITDLKNKVSGLIGFAASLFENIGVEEVMFLVLRFCGLMGNIENSFNALTSPLEMIQDNYQSTVNKLISSSNLATSGAIAAGATRYQAQELNAGFIMARDTYRGYIGGATGAGGNYTFNDSPNGVRSWVGDGTPPGGRDLRARSFKIVPPTSEELDALPTWEDIQSGSDFWSFSSGMGRYGYIYAQTLEKVMLLRVRRKWGRKFNINSGFRSISYNSTLRGASQTSIHLSGQAWDIGVVSENFVNIARSEGFGGIGRYSSFTHIDSGPVKSW